MGGKPAESLRGIETSETMMTAVMAMTTSTTVRIMKRIQEYILEISF